MPARKGNKNAQKEITGIQVNLYLSANDVATIKRILERQEEASDVDAIRDFARRKAKEGIWNAIKSDFAPIIL